MKKQEKYEQITGITDEVNDSVMAVYNKHQKHIKRLFQTIHKELYIELAKRGIPITVTETDGKSYQYTSVSYMATDSMKHRLDMEATFAKLMVPVPKGSMYKKAKKVVPIS